MSKIGINEIRIVAEKLCELDKRFVLIGGCSPQFIVDVRYKETVRPTMDIDFVIESESRIDYSNIEQKLRDLGFKHDMRPNKPKCKWHYDKIEVDILPSSPKAAEFGSRWFEMALDMAFSQQLDNGLSINVINPACFLAAKLDAFFDRGKNDYYGSADLEDIIMLLESCSALLEDIQSAPKELRTYVANGINRLLGSHNFIEALPGHLSPESPPRTGDRVLDIAGQIVDMDKIQQ